MEALLILLPTAGVFFGTMFWIEHDDISHWWKTHKPKRKKKLTKNELAILALEDLYSWKRKRREAEKLNWQQQFDEILPKELPRLPKRSDDWDFDYEKKQWVKPSGPPRDLPGGYIKQIHYNCQGHASSIWVNREEMWH